MQQARLASQQAGEVCGVALLGLQEDILRGICQSSDHIT
jgi:hypothetical protein